MSQWMEMSDPLGLSHLLSVTGSVTPNFQNTFRRNDLPVSFPALSGQLQIEIGEVVSIGEDRFRSPQLETAIEQLIPWRTGPWKVCGIEIDTEWQSNLKWSRIREVLGDIEDKVVLDVGCNNGYFLFQLLKHHPRLIVGVERGEVAVAQFLFLSSLIAEDRSRSPITFLPTDYSTVTGLEEVSDLIICCGVIYHRKDPVELVRRLASWLRPGGELILESMGIHGQESLLIPPKERYAKAHNVYVIPTAETLMEWFRQCEFSNVELVSDIESSILEQRRTRLAPYESLADFLDPTDSSKTVEGYPAPRRLMVKGKKR